jgi:uncharacterized protein YggE
VRKIWLLILPLAVGPAFGQLESNTVTISATRSISLQPDQVVYSLTVNSALNATLDQIVAALSGLGITSANLTGVNNNSAPQTLQWSFALAAPFSNLGATIGSLIKLQQTITQNNSGLALTFSIAGTQVSAQLQQSQSCSNSGLIADATAQAQKLAAAAGLTLGPILKLSNGPLAQSSVGLVGNVVPGAASLGDLSDFLLGAAEPTTCSLVVQFQLQF